MIEAVRPANCTHQTGSEQTPAPGSKEAILGRDEDIQRGAPNYDRMSAPLVKVHRQARCKRCSATRGRIDLRGVGAGGYDIYGVKFGNGFAEICLRCRRTAG